MKNFFDHKTTYQDLLDLEIKISEYDKVLIDFKSFESNGWTDFYKKIESRDFDWDSYLQPLDIRKYSTFFDISDYISSLTEEVIDRELDSVGFARQLKRKRRALIEVQARLQKNKKKLLRIQKRILKSTYKYNVTHDYRQDLRQVLRKHMPLSVDEEESSSIALLNAFEELNASIELINNKIKSLTSWIKKEYLVSLDKYLSRKNYLLKIEPL